MTSVTHLGRRPRKETPPSADTEQGAGVRTSHGSTITQIAEDESIFGDVDRVSRPVRTLFSTVELFAEVLVEALLALRPNAGGAR